MSNHSSNIKGKAEQPNLSQTFEPLACSCRPFQGFKNHFKVFKTFSTFPRFSPDFARPYQGFTAGWILSLLRTPHFMPSDIQISRQWKIKCHPWIFMIISWWWHWFVINDYRAGSDKDSQHEVEPTRVEPPDGGARVNFNVSLSLRGHDSDHTWYNIA